MSFSTPILVIGFNRPKFSSQVLEILRQIKPLRLYVACDGPRPDCPLDVKRCLQVRQLHMQHPQGMIDWQCEMSTLFANENNGCRQMVESALDWVFLYEDEVIILEDDILPDLSFFPYCRELLARFRFDLRVGAISANNPQNKAPSDGNSYRFSIYSHAWGWATWKRAWQYYDKDLAAWPEFRDSGMLSQLGDAKFVQTWTRYIDQLKESPNRSVWDIIWQFSCWHTGFLTVVPEVELVENIGFGSDATHTLDEPSPLGQKSAIRFPLKHPEVIASDQIRDQDTFRRLHSRTFIQEWRRKCLKALRLLNLR